MVDQYCRRCSRKEDEDCCLACERSFLEGVPKMFVDRTGEIHAGDMVRNTKTGEKLIVAGVSRALNQFVPMGYPFPSIEKICEYELVERNAVQVTEHVRNSLKKHGMESYIEDE